MLITVDMKRFLLILAGLLVLQSAFAQRQRRPVTPADTLNSVRVHPDGSVTFSIFAPEAHSVALGSDLSGKGTFTKDADGIWSATIPDLQAIAYRYHFVVDGVQVYDPRSPQINDRRPVLQLTKGQDLFWAHKDVPHGAISVLRYPSTTIGTERQLHVWTPAGYIASGKELPVLYLVHGMGDSDADWSQIGCAGDILDNLLAEGKIEPMVVVMPNGAVSVNQFPDELTNDIRPFIEKNFKVKKGPANTALAGLSMGGMETKATITAHPTDYCYVGIFSGGTLSVEESRQMPGFRENNKLIFINYGSYEVANIAEGRPDPAKLTQELKESGLNAHYLVTPDSAHEWKTWRLALYTFSQLLFK